MTTQDIKDSSRLRRVEAGKKKSTFGKILETHDEIKLPKLGDLIECTIVSLGKNEVVLDYKGIASGVVRGNEIYDESGVSSSFEIGDTAIATVLELDNEKGFMELSFRHAGHKQAWDNLEKMMKEEKVAESKVIDANKGGLMVKVGNVVGFLPVSQLTTKYYPRVEGGDKGKILGHLRALIGQIFDTVIIDVDEKENKLIVSQRSAWAEEQKKTLSNCKIGKIIEGKVTGVARFGAFVEFGENLEGLVHISEIAWQRIDSPNDVIKVGDKVKAEIISVDDGRISLSMKRLTKDPWEKIAKKYKVNQKVKGKVLKINPFGAFVELDKDIHGLAHISELSNRIINSPEDVVSVGEEYEFVIINLEPKEHRLGLSLKSLKEGKKTKKQPSDSAKSRLGSLPAGRQGTQGEGNKDQDTKERFEEKQEKSKEESPKEKVKIEEKPRAKVESGKKKDKEDKKQGKK